MNGKRTSTIAPILATLIALAIALPVAAESKAESTAELLEKGIYTEQTVGDLAAAIEIYKRVVENDEANRPHVAQAQFQLGMCYLKRGNDAEARAAFDKLIKDFPEQEQLVAQAEEQLASARPELALDRVPWKDGESLEYRIGLATGKALGSLWMTTQATDVDGVDAWRLELRKMVLTQANNQGVSRILVERDTLRPISSEVRHGILGNADATYGADGAVITAGTNENRVSAGVQIYDNEQTMHLLRMLPFEVGYKTEISLLPTWVAEVVDVAVEVTAKETCEVPVGEFECWSVALQIGEAFQKSQTLWFSTGPERYLLKQKAGGVMIELIEIGQAEPGVPASFGIEEFGFSGALPADWAAYERSVSGRANKAVVRFLDPEAVAISNVEIDRCPQGRCPSLQENAERELAGARERFDSYAMREGSWTERTIDGRPAISFVGDFLLEGQPWVQYRLYTFIDDVRFEFIFRSPSDSFDALRADFDSVAENLRAR